MNFSPSIQRKSQQVGQDIWLKAIERAILAAELAELELSRQGGDDPSEQRKASGSFYTPSDVASHFWDLFFRHHQITDLTLLLAFISKTDLVEPSAGSAMFVFSFLRKAALLGATPQDLTAIRFHVVDINLSALRFFSERLREIEEEVGARFTGIGPSQGDFLEWLSSLRVTNVIFVGNPPFVSNFRTDPWRNLYANFVEAMLKYKSVKGISLILPLSVCFSRDYAKLRTMIRSAHMGISASSYDNIPDCLFKAGKPDSKNSNRANSQRCTIINLGGPNPNLMESSPLINWTSADRAYLLSSIPVFRVIKLDNGSGQIPRPASDSIVEYMNNVKDARPLREFLNKVGRSAFYVGGVARNFVGIRDLNISEPGSIAIKASSEEDGLLLLQIISSALFFDYWRTYGDGFHVTVDLIERFPITNKISERCYKNTARAREIWSDRSAYAKTKLNSGKLVRSYDFRNVFDIS